MDSLALDVRRYDRDRFVTALFAPADRRDALIALYAFNIEIARIRETVSEPILGQIRLQWWRDTLDGLYRGETIAHPVALALAGPIASSRLDRSLFDRLLEARETDLDPAPPADLDALERYAEGTSASLNRLALGILGADDPESGEAARDLGMAWALTGILRAFPYHLSAGKVFLPESALKAEGLSAEALMAGQGGDALVAVGRFLAERARFHLDRARRGTRPSKASLPALLTAPLAACYLSAFARAGHQLKDRNWSAVRPRPLRLAWHHYTGRL